MNALQQHPLTQDQIRRAAPSVFTETKFEGTSSKYSFISTMRVVNDLSLAGWLPVQAVETRVKKQEKRGFQKHMIRFRKYNGTTPTLNVGDSLVEMVLSNSHDGTSSYRMHMGIFRLVCSNGLVIADKTFQDIKFRHVGFNPEEIIDASYKIVEQVPMIEDRVNKFQNVMLDEPEKLVLAESAMMLKYEEGNSPVRPDQLLLTRRTADNGSDLWTVTNKIQENIIRGGLRGVATKEVAPGVMRTVNRKTRAVQSIDENLRLNKAIWNLADKMAELKN